MLLYSTASPTSYNFIPGVLKKEINKSESFEFDIYPSQSRGSLDPDLIELKTGYHYISIEDTNTSGPLGQIAPKIMFYGRISHVEYDLQGKRHVTCEGLLSNLLDFPMFNPYHSGYNDRDIPIEIRSGIHRVVNRTYLGLFYNAINAYRCGTRRDDIILWDPNDDTEMPEITKQYESSESEEDPDAGYYKYLYPWEKSVGEFIESELIGVFGGIIKLEYDDAYVNGIKGHISWIQGPAEGVIRTQSQSQDIIYGDNLLDATLEDTNTEYPSGIFPVGTDNTNTKIWFEETINYDGSNRIIPWAYYGNNYVADSINTCKVVNFDDAKTFDQLDDIKDLYVNLYCSSKKYRINAKVLDKHYSGLEDETYAPIDVGYTYHVVVPFIGRPIEDDLVCLNLELDLKNLENSSYTFGEYIPPDLMKSRYITG